MNYASQPGVSYISIGPHYTRMAGVFMYPERIHITHLTIEGIGKVEYTAPADKFPSKPEVDQTDL